MMKELVERAIKVIMALLSEKITLTEANLAMVEIKIRLELLEGKNATSR